MLSVKRLMVLVRLATASTSITHPLFVIAYPSEPAIAAMPQIRNHGAVTHTVDAHQRQC